MADQSIKADREGEGAEKLIEESIDDSGIMDKMARERTSSSSEGEKEVEAKLEVKVAEKGEVDRVRDKKVEQKAERDEWDENLTM